MGDNKTKKESKNYKIAKGDVIADYSFYESKSYNKQYKSENAFVFGSAKLTFDKDKIQFVVDQNGHPVEIRNFVPMPFNGHGDKQDNFDYEGGSLGANAINHLLIQITDPSNIGKKVLFNYTNTDKLPSVTVSKPSNILENFFEENELENYFGLSDASNKMDSILTFLSRLYGFWYKFKQIQASGVINYLDQNNKLVIFGTKDTDTIRGSRAKNLDLSKPIDLGQIKALLLEKVKPVLDEEHFKNFKDFLTLIFEKLNERDSLDLNHYSEKLGNGITYVSGGR